MLLHDQRVTKWYHEEYTEKTADETDNHDLYEIRLLHETILRPQEHRRKREDRAGSQ